MSFENFGLNPAILRAVRTKNYLTPTPIQLQAIPAVLEGRDVIGCAQTGTGKTAGFTLPLLQRLQNGPSPSLRALILVPTRELATQVHESVRTYGRHLRLRTVVVLGGVGINPQTEALRRGVDILIATPGRLLDHMRQRNVQFKQLEVLVIDEADRMLDMGFIADIRQILKSIPSKRQTLFFSATMPEEIQKLAGEILNQPQVIEIAPQGTPVSGVRQVVYPVETTRKRELLVHLIEKEKMPRVLVFTRTKHRADDLAAHLKLKGNRAESLHGNKSQQARTKALEAFRNGSVQVLVATNLAARGLDVKKVSHVVNYEIPDVPEDYLHRIGRTARAETTGDAISLVSPAERGSLRSIEQYIGSKIPQVVMAGFENGEKALGLVTKRSFRPRSNRYRR
ncbi:MAG: DEAD/DEAH box helicase [Acidobacteria bacterium]|nr:DEAD/DEAH box helicase [Acidobacteriota bacterium]MBI3656704.1 DEAD/DEAH box helicase [Acidobacteriota bacterium]